MSDNVPPATTPEDGELSLAELVFLRISEQRERDWAQDRRMAALEREMRVMREFVEQMGAFSGAISQMANRITSR